MHAGIKIAGGAVVLGTLGTGSALFALFIFLVRVSSEEAGKGSGVAVQETGDFGERRDSHVYS